MSGPSTAKNRMEAHDKWSLNGSVQRDDQELFADRAVKVAQVALADATGAAGIFAWQNPEDNPIIVDKVQLDITTEATGAATADVGTDGDGTGSSDNLIDGADIGAAAVPKDNIDHQGTNGAATRRLDENGGTTDWITASGVADPAGLEGFAYIHYHSV